MSIEKNTPNILKHSCLSFTTIINEVINTIKDAAALGLYVYLASKPGDWVICNAHLENHFGKGREFITNRMKYLQDLKLIEKNAIRNEKGEIIRWETHLHRIPHQNTENPYSSPIHQNTGLPESGFSGTTNKREIQIKEKNYCASHDARLVDNSRKLTSPKNSTGTSSLNGEMDSNNDLTFFDVFWKVYPVKQNKKKAKQIWGKKKLDEKTEFIVDDILARIDKHAPWKNGFIPHPTTYLTNERWNDEIQEFSAYEISRRNIEKNKPQSAIDQRAARFKATIELAQPPTSHPTIIRNDECSISREVLSSFSISGS